MRAIKFVFLVLFLVGSGAHAKKHKSSFWEGMPPDLAISEYFEFIQKFDIADDGWRACDALGKVAKYRDKPHRVISSKRSNTQWLVFINDQVFEYFPDQPKPSRLAGNQELIIVNQYDGFEFCRMKIEESKLQGFKMSPHNAQQSTFE